MLESNERSLILEGEICMEMEVVDIWLQLFE